MDERLAGYLAVLSDDGHPVVDSAATLTRGQFHDVVLAGEVAYRFPRDQQTCRRLPTRVALLAELSRCQLRVQVPEPLDTSHLDRPAGGCYVAVRRLHGEPAVRGQITGERAQAGLASQAAGLLDELAVLGRAAEVRRVVPLAGTEQWPEWGAQVRRVLFPLMSSAGRRRAEAELSAVAAVSGSGEALVHSDLGGANLLLTRRSGVPMITGVLVG